MITSAINTKPGIVHLPYPRTDSREGPLIQNTKLFLVKVLSLEPFENDQLFLKFPLFLTP